MFVDRALARRLERTEGMIGEAFVAIRRAAGVNAASREIAGAIAHADGPDSPHTQTFGLGIDAPATATDLAEIEAFFSAHGAPTMHEVSPFAGVATTAALVAGGYMPIEMSNVLVREIGDVAPPAGLRVRVIDGADAADVARFVETSLAGWCTDDAAATALRPFIQAAASNREMAHYIIEDGATPIATGSLGLHDDIAYLAGASTIPSARGRGAQNALLAARLHDAKGRGCTHAMIVTEVGSTSQRNAQRRGFAVAYTRTKWRKDA